MVISFPAALRNALVHRTFRGLRFILRQQSIENPRAVVSANILEVFMTPNTPMINNKNSKTVEFPLTLMCKIGKPLHRCEQKPSLHKNSLNITSGTSLV